MPENRISVLFILFLLPLTAFAQLGLPVDWAEKPSLGSEAIEEPSAPVSVHYQSQQTYTVALTDPEDRVSDIFHLPESLRDDVLFWMRIYTEFSSTQSVFYDSRDPAIVYEVMDFTDLKTKSKNLLVYEILRERAIAEKFRRYRSAFQKMSRQYSSRFQPKTQEEKNILSATTRLPKRGPTLFHTLNRNFRLQTGLRNEILKGYDQFQKHRAFLEELFKSLEVPPELVMISMVESSFNLRAVSKAGAKGVWQFMPASAREFLYVDDESGIDERFSPLKAGIAAARLLRRNYRVIRSWPLAVTAYNSGLRPLLRLSRAERTEKHLGEVFSHKYAHKTKLGLAGINYYSEFLALLYADRYRDVFFPTLGSSPQNGVANSGHLQFYRTTKRQTGLQIATSLGVPYQEFLRFNPDLPSLKTSVPSGFWVALPILTYRNEVTDMEKWAEIFSRLSPQLSSIGTNNINHTRRADNKL